MKGLIRGLTLAAMALLLAVPVQAGGFFLQVHGGYAVFGLDDVNDAIDRVNDSVGGKVMDSIHSGFDAGVHAGFAINRELDLGFGFSRQWASGSYAGNGYLVKYDLPADLYEISLDYLPLSEKSVRFGAGSTMGMIRSAASVLENRPGFPDRSGSFEGAGFHFSVYALMDAPLSPIWSLLGQLGFRHALLNHLKVDGETVYNPDSVDDKLRFNYSGLLLRVGLKFRP